MSACVADGSADFRAAKPERGSDTGVGQHAQQALGREREQRGRNQPAAARVDAFSEQPANPDISYAD